MQEEIFERYPIPKAYFKLAFPVVFSMVISLVYNMVDTYFIAGTGNTDLVAGVALGSPIFTLMIALGDIFGLGGSSFISRLFGEKKYEDAKRISVFSFYGAIVSGVVVAAILMIFRSRCWDFWALVRLPGSMHRSIIPVSRWVRRLSLLH